MEVHILMHGCSSHVVGLQWRHRLVTVEGVNGPPLSVTHPSSLVGFQLSWLESSECPLVSSRQPSRLLIAFFKSLEHLKLFGDENASSMPYMSQQANHFLLVCRLESEELVELHGVDG
jgi:hypothetical protein